MNKEIRSLKSKSGNPSILTMFMDATDPPAFSYSRIVGFMVIVVFLILAGYLSILSGNLIVPSKEWVYIIVVFAAAKPIQRFAEAKDNENQLNYDFQIKQLGLEQPNPTPPQPPQE